MGVLESDTICLLYLTLGVDSMIMDMLDHTLVSVYWLYTAKIIDN